VIEEPAFFAGRYKGKAITVHSNLKGEERDETVEQLINVENAINPTEIVVHVNMLKEGWDVHQSVHDRASAGRQLEDLGGAVDRSRPRLPYGKRTLESAVDRLTIVAHDRFQEIVDYAKSPRFHHQERIQGCVDPHGPDAGGRVRADDRPYDCRRSVSPRKL